MNSSPNQRQSPKEKRTFTFFRSRTLSNSSNESAGTSSTSGLASAVAPPSTSPRLSPRSIFDKVRKRSQSDVKSPPTLEQINASNLNSSIGGSGSGINSGVGPATPRTPSQQDLFIKKLNGSGNSDSGGSMVTKSRAGSLRKNLGHSISISEENDETIFTELNTDGSSGASRRTNRMASESSEASVTISKSKVLFFFVVVVNLPYSVSIG